MRKIAVAMAKGGVGKTTTAVNLAHGLAMRGHRVLLVDCDTQGQTAKFLGIAPPHGLYAFITGQDAHGQPVDRRDTIAPARPNLWLLGGGIGLVELKHWLGEQPRNLRQSILAQALVPRDGALDYLIFDCAPGWDVLSVNILMAATEVLCPVALQGPALEGLKTFFGYLMSAQRRNEALELKYILPTMYDRRTRQSSVIHHKLQKLFRKQICDPIRYNVRLSEAPSRGQSIFEYRRTASGASDYDRLVERITNGARS
ncbi:MAG: ParA family protein [Desulfobacterales bacterium]|nr:ParA family protein [Desulfobacterales bacterium]